MEINKNNYQVWISDYFDGSLSDSDIAILLDFLDLYPELRDEFNSYEELVLHPDISIRMDKDALRKDLSSENKDAIEYYALALAENDLDPEGETEFKELTRHSEKAESEAGIYASLKLVPENINFPDKSRLKRIPLRLGFARTTWRILAVAASLALLVSLSIFLPREAESDFTYNAAYLLPFNSGEQLTPDENTGHTLILDAGRVPLKEINIIERKNDSSLEIEKAVRQNLSLPRSSFLTEVPLESVTEPGYLLAMRTSDPPVSVLPEENLSPRQFIAMNFRKHLLKEDVSSTDKIKVYEVADVSIDGLNKLLGWEMQFEKEKTEDGRLAAFKFTSQLLNLDHKMKNVDE